MKICIIGASGYIGGWLVNYLKTEGHNITAVYRKEPICKNDWKLDISQLLVGDVSDETFLDSIIATNPEIVIYLISLNHIQSDNNFFTTLNTNVSPLGYLSNGLTKSKGFKKIIYFSTLQVLGKINNGQLVDEFTKPIPVNNYGLTHLFCEETLGMLNRTKGLNYTALRLANSYGPSIYDSCDILWLVINDFCMSALQKNVIQLKSDGTPQRDFIYLKDVARAVEFLISSKEKSPDIINVCSETTMTMLELAHLTKKVCNYFGLNIRILLPDGSESLSCENHQNIERYKIKSWLYSAGFRSEVSLEEGIKNTIENFMDFKTTN